MRKILLVIAVILLSHTDVKAYDVFPDSNGNTLSIRINNTSSVFPIPQVKISKQSLPDWVTGLSPNEVNIGTIAVNQSATATFTFNIAAKANIGAAGDMVLRVGAGTGDAWNNKRIPLVIVKPNGSISGWIYRISGVTVQAVGPVIKSTTTDDIGKYTIADLPPGTYTVTASKFGYRLAYNSEQVIVTAGTVTAKVCFTFFPDCSISGKVIMADLSPITVPVTVQVVGPTTRSETTNVYGKKDYTITGLPPGTYTVTISQVGGYISTPVSRKIVTVETVTTGVDFITSLPKGKGTFYFKSLYFSWWRQWEPLSGINVELYKGNTLVAKKITDESGYFQLSGLDAVVDYKVKAWDNNGVYYVGIDDIEVHNDEYENYIICTTGTISEAYIEIRAEKSTRVFFGYTYKKKAAANITLSSPSLPTSIRNIDTYRSYAATLRKGAPLLVSGTGTEAAPLLIVPILKTGGTIVHLSTTRDVAEVPSLSYTIEGATHEPQKIVLTGGGSDFEGKMYIESTTPEGTATFYYSVIDEAGSNTQIEYGKEFIVDTTIYPQEGGEVSNRDGSLARLPAGALMCPVNIRIINAQPNLDGQTHLEETASLTVDRLTLTCLPRTKRQFSAQIDGKEGEEVSISLKKFTICLPYLDIDDDGLVDNIAVPEEKLRIVYEDANGQWKIADEYTIDTIANKVTAEVTVFTKYMLASIVEITTVDKIISYPNPWHTDKGGLIKISYIPFNSQPEIYIYNIAGELVRTFHEGREIVATDRGYMEADWDGKNDSGDNVASGIYLYLIKCHKGTKTGKMGIIR